MQNPVIDVHAPKPPGLNDRYTIKGITDHVTTKITKMGFDVYIAFSNTKCSKSRDLEIRVGDTRYKIRISDHPLPFRRRFDFDIYTDRPRRGAIHYKTFEGMFAGIVKKARNMGETGKYWENRENVKVWQQQ